MISIKYPVSGEDFVNRVELLRNIHKIYPVDNVALVGPRRIGKSSVAEQFLKTLTDDNTVKLRFNVQTNIGTPGKFAMRLLRSFLFAYYECLNIELDSGIEDIEVNSRILMDISDHLNSKVFLNLSRFIISYYPPSPENEREVLGRTLKFIDDFSIEMGIKSAIVLDEFQEIVDLNKYQGFKNGNLLGFLEDIISRQKNTWYLFTGSAVRLMEDIIAGPTSPFLGRIIKFNVKPFNKEDTIQLVYKCIEQPITSEALNFLFDLSQGHPFYTVILAKTASGNASDFSIISKHHIEESFISELSAGALDIHCKYLFETSLNRLKGRGTFMMEILRELSSGRATLTELSKRLGRQTGYLSTPLRNLYNIDLIDKDKKAYYIADSVLTFWLKNIYGNEETELQHVKERTQANYKEYFASLSSEAGIFFESYLREMLNKFDGQKYQDIQLPKFDDVNGINMFDSNGDVFGRSSNIEVDALCRGTKNWLFEFKYRKKSVGKKDIALLKKKRDFVENKLEIKVHKIVFIAKSSFSEYALQSDVWCLTMQDINKLLSLLNMKKVSEVFKVNEL
ncbi:MAG: ATP-binding protein [Desulfosarcina sp.]|nr:ATP-binding protein [Desulfobacterales bacterium]